MTPQNQLSIEGNFFEHPFAEMVAELSHGKLTGSLRVSFKEQKCVIYFKEGCISFAVSNARSSRIFEIVRHRGRLTKEILGAVPNIANDFEFADYLEDNGHLTRSERAQLFVTQIETILIDILSWTAGQWSFSALARLKDGLFFEIDSGKLLCEYSRCMPTEQVLNRFRSMAESFVRTDNPDFKMALGSEENLILSNLSSEPRTVEDVAAALKLPAAVAMKALYSLWLAGAIERRDWKPALSEQLIAEMHGAKLELISEARIKVTPDIVKPAAEAPMPDSSQAKPDSPEIRISLDEYLSRVENAETLYDVLGIEVEAEHMQIRHAYFGLAKVFHPDHYHQEAVEIQRRVQNAFTELAKAHETLKTPESREHYNFKIRAELADRKKSQSAGTYDERSRRLKQAIDNFERGFSLLVENDTEAALPFLARAAHFDPANARFHAYYGKALSFDEKQRHKAESEMQTALRLDPQNPTFRILLVEFFIQMNLVKRAEGELNRLLAIFPSNREARNLLESLQK